MTLQKAIQKNSVRQQLHQSTHFFTYYNAKESCSKCYKYKGCMCMCDYHKNVCGSVPRKRIDFEFFLLFKSVSFFLLIKIGSVPLKYFAWK